MKKQEITKSPRQSNMELLRIVSMIMIVMFHCNASLNVEPGTGNYVLARALWIFGGLGDNLFVLISGYFSTTSRFKWSKLIFLIVEVQFYQWLATFIGCQLGVYELPVGRDLFLAFFPVITGRWWFITAYILLYIVSPYLRILTDSLSDRHYRMLLLTVLTPFCFIPTVFGIFFGSTESFMYYSGCVWLIIVYLLGGYIRRVQEQLKKSALMLTLISIFIIALSMIIIDCYDAIYGDDLWIDPLYFRLQNNVVMVGLSMGIFGLFLHIRIPYNRAINIIASTALGIYLLSENRQLSEWIWFEALRVSDHSTDPNLILYILGATAVIFTVCVPIDLLRQKCQTLLIRLIQYVRSKRVSA